MECRTDVTPGFCPNCGTILPPLKQAGGVSCFLCNCEFDSSVFGEMLAEYTVHFNKIPEKSSKVHSNEDENEAEGPVIERKCPKCGNNKMSYATLQLRSADEGQTVFYTCTKCQFKETENS